MVADGGMLTVMVELLEVKPLAVAETVVLPAATPVTIPDELPTEAVEGAADVNTGDGHACGGPDDIVAVQTKGEVQLAPTKTEQLVGAIAIDTTIGGSVIVYAYAGIALSVNPVAKDKAFRVAVVPIDIDEQVGEA